MILAGRVEPDESTLAVPAAATTLCLIWDPLEICAIGTIDAVAASITRKV